jgi:hypothetical protein
MFSFFLPKEIDADKVKGRKDVREALLLAAKNNIPIQNIDYFENHDNYIRFQSVFINLFLDAKHGRLPHPIGVKLRRMDDAYGLGKMFDAERNMKYFTQLEQSKQRSLN